MKISIVIPVFNESGTIKTVLGKVKRINIDKEIVVVDDGSTDGTREILKNEVGCKVIYHDKNHGKGAAIRTGFKHASGDIIIIQDADLEYDPSAYESLIEPIVGGLADVVYGSRMLGGKPLRVSMFWHKVGNNFLTFLTDLLYNTTLSDMETGYKVFRKDVIKNFNLKSKGFSIEVEITAKIFKDGRFRVYEVPISYYGRTYKEGKKITWRQGFSALFAIFWYRFFN